VEATPKTISARAERLIAASIARYIRELALTA
jgi:hypothetical protein